MDHEEQTWEANAEEHRVLHERIDRIGRRTWASLGILVPIMALGVGVAIRVWADTDKLKAESATHATTADVDNLRRDRDSVDRAQTRALNWQTQAVEAIAEKLNVRLPSRPPMVEE